MKVDESCVKRNVVLEMVDWINDNIQENIRSIDVTKTSGYTHWHFQKLFKDITGHSLADFIRLTRIISVTEELMKSKYKITHISYDYGFPTQQTLTRMFRKYFNCTPTHFRRTVKANPDLHEVIKSKLMAGEQLDLETIH